MIFVLIFFFLIFFGATITVIFLGSLTKTFPGEPGIMLLFLAFLVLTAFFGLLIYRRISKRKGIVKNPSQGVRVEHSVSRVVSYCFLLLFICIVYVMYIEDIALVILVFAVLYPVSIFAILFYAKKKINLSLLINSNYEVRKHPLSIIINIDNPTVFPISRAVIRLKYNNSFSDYTTYETFEVPIKARTSQQLICNAVSEHCGEFTVTLCEIRIFDYVRNFSLKKVFNSSVDVKITPIIYDVNCLIESTDIQHDSDKLSEYFKGDDPTQIFDLRDYTDGDKLNKIHWKLTVKLDKPIVKEYSQSISAGYALVFNFDTFTDMSVTDALLETLYSISYFLISNDKTLKICYYSGSYDEVLISDENDLFKLNEIFIKKYKGSDVLGSFIENNSNTLFSHVIYISGNVDEISFITLGNIDNSYKKSALALTSEIDEPNLYILNPIALSSSLDNLIL
jgi:uncharacterized protein (DUF58 family)